LKLKKNNFSIGVVVGFISFLLSILQSILIVPFIFRFWGNDNYSIWIIIIGVINLFRTFDNGHQSYIGNEFGKLIISNPIIAKSTLSSAVKIALLIGVLQSTIFAFILTTKIDILLFGINFTKYSSNITYLFVFLWIITTSIGGILAKILSVVGFYSRAQIWGIIQKICEILTLLIGIKLQYDIIKIFTIFSCVMLFYTIFAMIDIRFILPEYYPWWKNGDIKIGYRNFKKSLALTGNSFLEQFTLTTINSSISNLFTTSSIPLYSTLRTIGNVISQFSSIILQPLQAEVIKFHNNNKFNQINYVIYFFWFFLYFFMFFPLLLSIPFLSTLYEFWTDGKIKYNSHLTIAVLSGVIIYNFGRFLIFYLSVINDTKALISNNIFRFLVIIPLSSLLGYFTKSLVTFAWGITIGEFIGSIILPLHYVSIHLKYQFNIKYVIRHISFLLFFILSLAILSYINQFLFYIISVLIANFLLIILWKSTPTLYKRLFKTYLKKFLLKVKKNVTVNVEK